MNVCNNDMSRMLTSWGDVLNNFGVPHRPEAFYVELGRRIASSRKEKKFTQSRLADLVGLSRTSITNIELGRQQVAVHLLVDLAIQLDVSLGELVPHSAKAVRHPRSDLQMPSSLDEHQRDWVARVIHGTDEKHGGG